MKILNNLDITGLLIGTLILLYSAVILHDAINESSQIEMTKRLACYDKIATKQDILRKQYRDSVIKITAVNVYLDNNESKANKEAFKFIMKAAKLRQTIVDIENISNRYGYKCWGNSVQLLGHATDLSNKRYSEDYSVNGDFLNSHHKWYKELSILDLPILCCSKKRSK